MPRFFIPGLSLHVIARGNDRMPLFRKSGDFGVYYRYLAHAARRHRVAVHAYVLMTNHVHLLATPRDRTGIPRMMQSIGLLYVRYFNEAYGRTGTLWEGRYKATIVETDAYLLACMRYIELNPVRAGIVTNPQHYRWSSYHANAYGADDRLVSGHAVYLSLGKARVERWTAYRELLGLELPGDALSEIRDATHYGWALGGRTFRDTVGSVNRRAARLPLGRPRRARSDLQKVDSDPTF